MLQSTSKSFFIEIVTVLSSLFMLCLYKGNSTRNCFLSARGVKSMILYYENFEDERFISIYPNTFVEEKNYDTCFHIDEIQIIDTLVFFLNNLNFDVVKEAKGIETVFERMDMNSGSIVSRDVVSDVEFDTYVVLDLIDKDGDTTRIALGNQSGCGICYVDDAKVYEDNGFFGIIIRIVENRIHAKRF